MFLIMIFLTFQKSKAIFCSSLWLVIDSWYLFRPNNEYKIIGQHKKYARGCDYLGHLLYKHYIPSNLIHF
jgi:hypothetical protein